MKRLRYLCLALLSILVAVLCGCVPINYKTHDLSLSVDVVTEHSYVLSTVRPVNGTSSELVFVVPPKDSSGSSDFHWTSTPSHYLHITCNNSYLKSLGLLVVDATYHIKYRGVDEYLNDSDSWWDYYVSNPPTEFIVFEEVK